MQGRDEYLRRLTVSDPVPRAHSCPFTLQHRSQVKPTMIRMTCNRSYFLPSTPPSSLVNQSYRPRRTRFFVCNRDAHVFYAIFLFAMIAKANACEKRNKIIIEIRILRNVPDVADAGNIENPFDSTIVENTRFLQVADNNLARRPSCRSSRHDRTIAAVIAVCGLLRPPETCRYGKNIWIIPYSAFKSKFFYPENTSDCR